MEAKLLVHLIDVHMSGCQRRSEVQILGLETSHLWRRRRNRTPGTSALNVGRPTMGTFSEEHTQPRRRGTPALRGLLDRRNDAQEVL